MFFKKITARLLAKSTPQGPQVLVAAFGKHPGWDDHIDDIGLQSELLVAIKRVLYIDGIGGNIDSGAWESIPEEHRLPGFDHLFVWRVREGTVVGRFWSSSDGKGRTRYPMVICAQCTGRSPSWLVRSLAPVLELARQACIQTTTADGVRAAVERAAAEAQACVQGSAVPAEDGALYQHAAERLASNPEMGPDSVGLMRIMYCIERELAAYRPLSALGKRSPTTDFRRVEPRPQNLRVPACEQTPTEAAALWLDFLTGSLVSAAPIFIAVPLGRSWVDVIVGDPGRPQFSCLRASPEVTPFTSEIPYNLEPAFVESAMKVLH